MEGRSPAEFDDYITESFSRSGRTEKCPLSPGAIGYIRTRFQSRLCPVLESFHAVVQYLVSNIAMFSRRHDESFSQVL